MDDTREPYALSVERRPGYLHVRVSGENTPETVAAYLRETVAACRAHGVNRVLIEEHLTGPSLRPMQMFDLIDLRAQPGPPAVAVAYVDVNPEHDFDRLQFAETVARNRGFLLRLFRTVPEAEQWLASL